MTPLTREEIEQVVGQLTPGFTHIRWVPEGDDAASTTTRRGQHIIEFGENLLYEPQRALFYAAHESGHIALGHTRPSSRAVAGLLALASLAVAVAATALVVTRNGPGAAGLAFFVTFGALVHLMFRLRYRPRELRADTFAHDHGYSMVGLAPDADRHWGHKMLSMHPSWEQRQKHAQNLVRKGH